MNRSRKDCCEYINETNMFKLNVQGNFKEMNNVAVFRSFVFIDYKNNSRGQHAFWELGNT